MKRMAMVLCAGALALGACEKDGGLSSKTSGSIRPAESTLLQHLPSGNVGLFGGNYLRIQDFFQNIGDKLGHMRGWIDINKGLAFDVSFQLEDAAMADEVARGIPEMKKQADILGKEVGAVIRGIKFERKGDRLRFALKVSEQQLERLMEQLAPLMGGGMGGGGDFGGF